MANRNGGPLKDLSRARHSVPHLTYSGIHFVTQRKIRLLQIVIKLTKCGSWKYPETLISDFLYLRDCQ